MKKQLLVLSLNAAILTTTPLFGMDHDDELVTNSNKTYRFSLQEMPKEIIRDIFECYNVLGENNSLAENNYRKNLFNLGNVCKKLYNIYLSEYVVGDKNAGVIKPAKFITDISKLLNGTPVNFMASKGKVGSFNFSDNYDLIIRGRNDYFYNGFDYSYEEALRGQPKDGQPNNNHLIVEEVHILTSKNIRIIDKPFPFEGDFSKIVYKEKYQPGFIGDHLHRNNPNWGCAKTTTAEATYTLYGKDKGDKEAHISYIFFKDFNRYW